MNENKEKTAGNLANSVVEGYDYSVAVRMSGRAGAYSPTGGKGNAFEVMYSDKKNLSNLLKPDTTTTLTNSSTARQVDLVTKKGNRIIERIQCKDTPSAKGTMDTIKRVQNGQYRTTQLVGTSESAAAFNAKELAACFNENISETVIRKIAGQHPRRAVFCDASFSDSAAKINMSELFRTISPETQIKVI